MTTPQTVWPPQAIGLGERLTFVPQSSPVFEGMTNGGFETGDLTGWTTGITPFTIINTDKHSGTYCAAANITVGTFLQQILAVNIPAITIFKFGFWFKETINRGTISVIQIIFTTSTINFNCPNVTDWTYVDLISVIQSNMGSTLQGVSLYPWSNGALTGNTDFVDDFSVLYF